MLEIEESGLFRQDIFSGCNIFAGAGFSVLAKNKNGRLLSDGAKLKDIIVETMALGELKDLDLQSIYAVAVSGRRDQVNAILSDELTVYDYDKIYDSLRNLEINSFYTTNIDDLAFHIFGPRDNHPAKILHDRTIYGTARDPNSVINYIPLHGCVRHEKPDYLFSPGQISSAFSSDRETWYVFQRELQLRPTIFVGYAVKDAGVLQALYSSNENQNNKWIILRDKSPAVKLMFESLGFKVAHGDTRAFLEYISQETPRIEKTIAIDSHLRIRHGIIPNQDEVAQRPVKNFFLGAEPEWSDAYSGLIVRRQVCSKIKNELLEGRSVAVVGLPLSESPQY